MNNEKIKLGILLKSVEIPAWQYYLIQQLLESDSASVKLIILSDLDNAKRALEPGTLYRVFERYDKARQDIILDACETRNAEGLISEIDSIRVKER